jgi:hypothetical protein
MAAPQTEDRQSIFNFFHKIIKAKDSLKTGNLEENELSAVRLIRQTSLYAGMMGWDFANDYLNQKSETILASSLSKKALLLQLAVTQKRMLSTRHLRRGQAKKRWFGGTQEDQPEDITE